MQGKNLPVLFLYKNKKRGDLVNVWAMGWGWGSLLRSDSLARCEKQKDKRLWTDYSRLDIMHHLRYDGTYRLSLFMELSQGVDVSYVMPCMLPGHVSQGPFHSYGVRRHLVNRARNDVLHKNKLKEKLFSICLATHHRKSGHMTTSNNSPPPGTKGWNCRCFKVCRAGKVYLVIYRNFQFSASSARKDTLSTSRYGQC